MLYLLTVKALVHQGDNVTNVTIFVWAKTWLFMTYIHYLVTVLFPFLKGSNYSKQKPILQFQNRLIELDCKLQHMFH